MDYQTISIELVVHPEDAADVVSELNSTLDRLEETHEIFGGAIEILAVTHSGTRRKSALRQTIDAGSVATSAVKLAAEKISNAYKRVI